MVDAVGTPPGKTRGGEAPRICSVGDQESLAVAYPKFVWANNVRVFSPELTGTKRRQCGDALDHVQQVTSRNKPTSAEVRLEANLQTPRG